MKKLSLSKILIIVAILFLGIGGLISYSYLAPKKEVEKEEEIFKNEIATWKIYQNDILDYSFKYPAGQFEIAEEKGLEGEPITCLKVKDALIPPDNIPRIEIKVLSLEKAEHLKRSIIWTYGAATKEPPTPIIDWETAKEKVTIEEALINGGIEAIKIYNKRGIINWHTPYQFTFFFIDQDKTFSISFIQPQDYPVDYLPTFHQILSTFKVL